MGSSTQPQFITATTNIVFSLSKAIIFFAVKKNPDFETSISTRKKPKQNNQNLISTNSLKFQNLTQNLIMKPRIFEPSTILTNLSKPPFP